MEETPAPLTDAPCADETDDPDAARDRVRLTGSSAADAGEPVRGDAGESDSPSAAPLTTGDGGVARSNEAAPGPGSGTSRATLAAIPGMSTAEDTLRMADLEAAAAATAVASATSGVSRSSGASSSIEPRGHSYATSVALCRPCGRWPVALIRFHLRVRKENRQRSSQNSGADADESATCKPPKMYMDSPSTSDAW